MTSPIGILEELGELEVRNRLERGDFIDASDLATVSSWLQRKDEEHAFEQECEKARKTSALDLKISADKANNLASESNEIALDANRSTREANDIAQRANRIARIAIVTAIIGIILSIVSIVVSVTIGK